MNGFYYGQMSATIIIIEAKNQTKSSTEAEIVVVDDAMNFVEWSKLLFDWQIHNMMMG